MLSVSKENVYASVITRLQATKSSGRVLVNNNPFRQGSRILQYA